MPNRYQQPYGINSGIAAMAQAAASAYAVVVRILKALRICGLFTHLSVPIIGIIKRDLTGSPVRITLFTGC